MAGKDGTAGNKKPAEQQLQATLPADAPSGTGLKTNDGHQLAGLAARTTAADQRRPAVQVSGGSAVVLAAMKAGSDLPTPVSTPPNAFACHCPYPLP